MSFSIVVVLIGVSVAYFGFVLYLLGLEAIYVQPVVSIFNSLTISSVISLILLLFEKISYRLYGSPISWEAIEESYRRDTLSIQDIFRMLESNSELKERVVGYFEYGSGIFSMYPSLIAATITSIGLVVTYLPKLSSAGYGVLSTNLVAVLVGISFGSLLVVLIFLFRYLVRTRAINRYESGPKKKIEIVLLIINLCLIVAAQLAEKNML